MYQNTFGNSLSMNHSCEKYEDSLKHRSKNRLTIIYIVTRVICNFPDDFGSTKLFVINPFKLLNRILFKHDIESVNTDLQ